MKLELHSFHTSVTRVVIRLCALGTTRVVSQDGSCVQEWGNPNEQQYYDYMKSYSPIDNVKPQVCSP